MDEDDFWNEFEPSAHNDDVMFGDELSVDLDAIQVSGMMMMGRDDEAFLSPQQNNTATAQLSPETPERPPSPARAVAHPVASKAPKPKKKRKKKKEGELSSSTTKSKPKKKKIPGELSSSSGKAKSKRKKKKPGIVPDDVKPQQENDVKPQQENDDKPQQENDDKPQQEDVKQQQEENDKPQQDDVKPQQDDVKPQLDKRDVSPPKDKRDVSPSASANRDTAPISPQRSNTPPQATEMSPTKHHDTIPGPPLSPVSDLSENSPQAKPKRSPLVSSPTVQQRVKQWKEAHQPAVPTTIDTKTPATSRVISTASDHIRASSARAFSPPLEQRALNLHSLGSSMPAVGSSPPHLSDVIVAPQLRRSLPRNQQYYPPGMPHPQPIPHSPMAMSAHTMHVVPHSGSAFHQPLSQSLYVSPTTAPPPPFLSHAGQSMPNLGARGEEVVTSRSDHTKSFADDVEEGRMEEYRDTASQASKDEDRLRRKNRSLYMCFIIFVVGLCLILAVVATVIFLMLRDDGCCDEPGVITDSDVALDNVTPAPVTPDNNNVGDNGTADIVATAPPTAVPTPTEPTTSPPTATPTYPDNFVPRNADLYNQIANFFAPDGGATIRQEGTAQNRAFRWLENDVDRDDTLSTERIIQRYALGCFYYATVGEEWTRNQLWMSEQDECLWQTDSTTGSNCDNAPNVVNRLEFSKNNIGGTFPPEFGLLSDLATLLILNEPTNIDSKVHGEIPAEWGGLTSIRAFTLKNQNLTGSSIPPALFENWNRAEDIIIERCKLQGKIPTTIGLLRASTKVSLRKNDLTGPIPTEVGDMTNMLQFSVDANSLTGRIPTEFGKMTAAKGIWVNKNQLVGPIPEEFGNMVEIKAGLRFSDNQLTGTIPAALGLLVDMKTFEVQNNLLQGQVPDFSALTNLKLLWDIRGNDLTGSVSDGTCQAIRSGGAEAYADCPDEVQCACCTNCP